MVHNMDHNMDHNMVHNMVHNMAHNMDHNRDRLYIEFFFDHCGPQEFWFGPMWHAANL